jgi:5-methyltetrahydrofolate--homocysteine methyltransferase
MSTFKNHLAEKEFLLADGATGTNYFALGLETGHPPEMWNDERPEHVRDIHARFLSAGSDLILTNSFGGTSFRLKLHGAEKRVGELNKKAAGLARQAVDEHEDVTERIAFVAGSMGPTGELFAPLGTLDHSAAVAAFSIQAESLAEGGVDLLWIETISSIEEVDAALEAAKGTGLPVGATMTFDTAGKSMMGVNPDDFAAHVSSRGAVAVGANCGVGPAELMHSLGKMSKAATVPLIAKGNCGIPEYVDGSIHYHGSPELMARYAILARDAGAKVIGGCCGTTPEHIVAMRKALDETPPSGPVDDARLVAELGQPWEGLDADQPKAERKGRRRRH